MYDAAKIKTLLDQRKPGHALPQAFYRDPAFYEFDLDAIFGRVWLFAGLDLDVPKPTGYVTLRIGSTSVILVRGSDGAIRGFFNTCRHRGAEICQAESDKVSRLVCPYHQWTYGLDGKLLVASGMPKDFDRSGYGLKPIHLEVVSGTIFICLAATPPDFAPIRRSLEPLLAPHELSGGKIAHEATIIRSEDHTSELQSH